MNRSCAEVSRRCLASQPQARKLIEQRASRLGISDSESDSVREVRPVPSRVNKAAICVHPRLSFWERSVGLWSAKGDFTEVTAPEDLFVVNSVLVKPVALLAVGGESDLVFGWLSR
jgi:hypothetical protein